MSAEEVQEEGCIATTFERKYYHCGSVFIKRSLRPNEFRIGYRGLNVPLLGKERLKNEAESLQFIQQHTDIPVPRVYCHFEDDQAYYLITEYIQSVSMSELPEGQKAAVREELESQRAKLELDVLPSWWTIGNRHSSISGFATYTNGTLASIIR